MILAASFGGIGLLLLASATLVLNSQRKNRLQIHRLNEEVERVVDRLRTPQERAAEAQRLEGVEARKRVVHGRFDSGGC